MQGLREFSCAMQCCRLKSKCCRWSLRKRRRPQLHRLYILPTADGVTTCSPKQLTSACVARQPVQCPGAMTDKPNERMSCTVCGMTFSFPADKWNPPATACNDADGNDSRACESTFTTPAC